MLFLHAMGLLQITYHICYVTTWIHITLWFNWCWVLFFCLCVGLCVNGIFSRRSFLYLFFFSVGHYGYSVILLFLFRQTRSNIFQGRTINRFVSLGCLYMLMDTWFLFSSWVVFLISNSYLSINLSPYVNSHFHRPLLLFFCITTVFKMHVIVFNLRKLRNTTRPNRTRYTYTSYPHLIHITQWYVCATFLIRIITWRIYFNVLRLLSSLFSLMFLSSFF